jgi:hypothetical protein
VPVCQGRAVAHGRVAPGRFSDPIATALLRPEERRPVELARAGTRPGGVADRVAAEWLAATADLAPVDLARDDPAGALARAGHRADLPTTWIWERVVPYLTRARVRRVVEAVAVRAGTHAG